MSQPADDPRRLLEKHGFGAKKSWGQNFLVDRAVLERIVNAAALGPDDVVIEIGAGTGALTAALAAASPAPRRIIAVERDPDMLHVLRAELGARSSVEVRAADAAALDFAAESAAVGRPVVVLGNLPYQIGSVILLSLARARGAVAHAIVMVQKEFAQRVVAPAGSKTYGRLSVMIQQRMSARILFHVGSSAFFPQPKITSSVMRLAPLPALLAPVADMLAFERVVKEAFGTRRKMLRRALEPAFGAEAIARAFERAGVAGTRRAEELTVADFARLTDALAEARPPLSP